MGSGCVVLGMGLRGVYAQAICSYYWMHLHRGQAQDFFTFENDYTEYFNNRIYY